MCADTNYNETKNGFEEFHRLFLRISVQFCVQGTVNGVHCTLYSVQCTIVHCTLYTINSTYSAGRKAIQTFDSNNVT